MTNPWLVELGAYSDLTLKVSRVVLSEYISHSDKCLSHFPHSVRIHLSFGQMSFSLSPFCPNTSLIRTNVFLAFPILSEYTSHSDKCLSCFPHSVRIHLSFGQMSFSLSSFCPNTSLIRTNVFLTFPILSEYTSHSDKCLSRFPHSVRIHLSFGQMSFSFSPFCPNTPLY